MTCRAQILTIVGAAVAVSVALVLASCSAFQRGEKKPSSTPTATPVAAAKPAAVYYSAVEGLKVYSEPSTRSKVVGSLSLHEKVTRTNLDRGYAYVEGAKGGLKGWVLNAQLIWRLPTTAAPAGAEPEAPAAPEAAPAAAEPLPEPAPVQAEPPRPKATPGGVAPSIFNPY